MRPGDEDESEGADVGLNAMNISRSCFCPLPSTQVTRIPEIRSKRPPSGKRPPGGMRNSPAPLIMKIASGPRAPLAMPTATGGGGGGGSGASTGLGSAPQGASSLQRSSAAAKSGTLAWTGFHSTSPGDGGTSLSGDAPKSA